MDTKVVIIIVLGLLSAILSLTCLALPFWSFFNNPGKEGVWGSLGLWSACLSEKQSGHGHFTCRSYADTLGEVALTYFGDGLDAARAMAILGLLSSVGALTLFLLRLRVFKDKVILNKVAAGFAIGAGLFMVIAAIVYATAVNGEINKLYEQAAPFTLHVSFYLTLLAAVLAFGDAAWMIRL